MAPGILKWGTEARCFFLERCQQAKKDREENLLSEWYLREALNPNTLMLGPITDW